MSRLIKRAVTATAAMMLAAGAIALAADSKELVKPAEPPAPAVKGPETPVTWKKIQLSADFHSEGAGVGDFNHDGKPDIVSGPFWYEGPNFSPDKKHQFYDPMTFDPKGYGPSNGKSIDPKIYSKNFLAFAYDFNGDGWDDILVLGFPGEDASWFENPKDPANSQPWVRHLVLKPLDNESPMFVDIDGDKKPDILCNSGGYLGYATADKTDPTKPWTFHKVSEKGAWQRFTHGIGYGDVNGDGKTDILLREGWWEQPAKLDDDKPWTFHKADFGGGGSQMFVYDVDGDGKNDVICSLAAHGYGLAWFKQNPDGTFTKNQIMGDKPEQNAYGVKFSQLHAVDLVDINGDGLPDIVTGKRYWAHGPTGDAEPAAAPVVYWFELKRKDGKAEFIPHLIDDNSGVGTQVMAIDVNGDKKPDIVVGNKKGTYVHIQQ